MTEPTAPGESQPPPQYHYGPPGGIQVTTLPGLSSGVHALNVVLSVLTCGGWLPFYLLIVVMSAPKRVIVHAPYGTPPQVVDEARRAALVLTPGEAAAIRSRNVGLLVAAAVVFVILVGGVTAVAVSR